MDIDCDNYYASPSRSRSPSPSPCDVPYLPISEDGLATIRRVCYNAAHVARCYIEIEITDGRKYYYTLIKSRDATCVAKTARPNKRDAPGVTVRIYEIGLDEARGASWLIPIKQLGAEMRMWGYAFRVCIEHEDDYTEL